MTTIPKIAPVMTRWIRNDWARPPPPPPSMAETSLTPGAGPEHAPEPEGRDPAEALSKLHDLGFFFFEKRVDLGHVTIGEFLNLVLRAALVILRDELLLQQVLEM